MLTRMSSTPPRQPSSNGDSAAGTPTSTTASPVSAAPQSSSVYQPSLPQLVLIPAFVTWHPTPPPCPPVLLSWLASAVGPMSGDLRFRSLTARSLLDAVNRFQEARRASQPLYQLPDADYHDIFTDFDQRRYIATVRDGAISGPCMIFLSNRGGLTNEERVAHLPADYQKRLVGIAEEERQRPGKPSQLAADVRPQYVDDPNCPHPGCGVSLRLRSKHHCRSCGHTFCAQHSQYRTPLPDLYYPLEQPQKVCDRCFKEQQATGQMLKGDVYIGEYANKVMTGWGALISGVTKSVYEGTIANNQLTGVATFHYSAPYRRTYIGQTVQGQRQGTGRMVYRDVDDGDSLVSCFDQPTSGESSRCEWLADLMEGEEVCVASYVGEWRDGNREGSGTLFTAKYRYQGGWLGNLPHGQQCTIVWSNGDSYVGDVVQGVRQGQGTLQLRQQGSIYQGEFAAEKTMTEQGTTHYSDGSMYRGQHLNGLPHGTGTIMYANGCHYQGEWRAGLRHGRGTITLTLQPAFFALTTSSLPTFPLQARTGVLPSPPARGWSNAHNNVAICLCSGLWDSDVPHGYGEVRYANNCLYRGVVNEGLCTDASGCTWYANGDCFQGSHVDGYRTGGGMYSYASEASSSVTGQWQRGVRQTTQIAECSHAVRKESYRGNIQYKRGGWFNSTMPQLSEPDTLDATDVAYSSPAEPDRPILSRHGEGELRSLPCGCTLYSRWVDDVQLGNTRWLLAGGAEVYGEWVRSPTSMGESHLADSGWMLQHGGARVKAASLSLCLMAIDQPSAASTTASCPHLQSVYDARTSVVDTFISPQPASQSALSASLVPSAAGEFSACVLSASYAFLPFGYCHIAVNGTEEWKGAMRSGKAEGWGEWATSAGGRVLSKYVGQWDAGRKAGIGCSEERNGSRYVGEFKKGLRWGLGMWSTSAEEGLVLDVRGQFHHGTPSGFTYIRCQQLLYAGEVNCGCLTGCASLHVPSGVAYSGQWEDGRPHGIGRLTSAFAVYAGSFAYGTCTGHGSLHVSAPLSLNAQLDKSVSIAAGCELLYEGELVDGEIEGQGQLLLRVRTDLGLIRLLLYTGSFRRQQFDGIGTAQLYHCSPQHPAAKAETAVEAAEAVGDLDCLSCYSGSWANGLKHGMGCMEDKELSTSNSDSTSVASPPFPLATTVTSLATSTGTFVRGVLHGYAQQTYQHLGSSSLPSRDYVEYRGAIVFGRRSGYGTTLFSNGDEHTGAYADDTMHGFGQLTTAARDTYQDGMWRDGLLWGIGVYYYNRDEAADTTSAIALPPTTHSIEKVQCSLRSGVLHGLCTFHWSPSCPASSPPTATIALVFHDGSLSAEHSVRVTLRDGAGQYTGSVLFLNKDAPSTPQSPAKSYQLYDIAALITTAKELSSVVLAADSPTFSASSDDVIVCAGRLESLLPFSNGPTPFTSSTLTSLCRQTGPFFAVHLLSVFLSHTRLIRDGVGRMVVRDREEYIGGWKNGSRCGDAVWTRTGRALWPTLHADRLSQAGQDGLERTVYVGRVSNNRMHGVGSLLLESRHIQLTTEWTSDAPNLSNVRLDDRHPNSHKRYIGSLDNNFAYNGFGTLTYMAHMDRFQGHSGYFINGKAEGNGVRQGRLGQYTGQFHADAQHGRGLWEGKDGTRVIGEWKNDSCIKCEPAQTVLPS